MRRHLKTIAVMLLMIGSVTALSYFIAAMAINHTTLAFSGLGVTGGVMLYRGIYLMMKD